MLVTRNQEPSPGSSEIRDNCATFIYTGALSCPIPVNETTVLDVWNANTASSLVAKSFRYI